MINIILLCKKPKQKYAHTENEKNHYCKRNDVNIRYFGSIIFVTDYLWDRAVS